MIDIGAPQSIVNLLEAIRIQVDVITTVSSGGFGVIIFTWARILGIFDDANLKNFRKPGFLAVPVVAFLCSIALGYLIGAHMTGYFTEIAKSTSADGTVIKSPLDHYGSDYYGIFNFMMGLQLWASLGGIFLLAIWYTCNVIIKERNDP